MLTYDDRRQFFETQWPALEHALQQGGAPALLELVLSHRDPLALFAIFNHMSRALKSSNWPGRCLDDFILVAEAGIREIQALAPVIDDDDLQDRFTAGYIRYAYQLAADLADCWPAVQERGYSGLRPEKHHFVRGLAAAEDALRWRIDLHRPPHIIGQTYWVRGMHKLSLERLDDARMDFGRSLAHFQQAAELDGQGLDPSPSTSTGLNLASGYVALGRLASGDLAAQADFDLALASLRAQLGDENLQPEAEFGIDQLETVHGRYVRMNSTA